MFLTTLTATKPATVIQSNVPATAMKTLAGIGFPESGA
jgi:hypothetical protein